MCRAPAGEGSPGYLESPTTARADGRGSPRHKEPRATRPGTAAAGNEEVAHGMRAMYPCSRWGRPGSLWIVLDAT